eukprot:m.223979 g.223979  ORF g.223979 m.223979 type:complete len:865 (+) comp33418_c0_seq1:131-2725(+)
MATYSYSSRSRQVVVLAWLLNAIALTLITTPVIEGALSDVVDDIHEKIEENLEVLVDTAKEKIITEIKGKTKRIVKRSEQLLKSFEIPKGRGMGVNDMMGHIHHDHSLHDLPDGVDRRTVILFPGLASTRLRTSKLGGAGTKCGGIMDEVVGGIRGSVWVNVAFITGATGCWMECMSLQQGNYSDNQCGVRPDDGLNSISEMAPGLVTGPMSAVWSHLIDDLIIDGHSPNMELDSMGYDWRLPMHMLDKRDGFFLEIKHNIELHVARRERLTKNFLYSKFVGPSVEDPDGFGVILVAHSMGNLVLRYFFDWLRNEVGMHSFQEWVDKHIYMGFFLGAGHLGAAQIMETVIEGMPAGLPLSKPHARELQTGWGSIPLMFPTGGEAGEWDARFKCDKCRQKHGDKGQALINVSHLDGSETQYYSDTVSNGTAWEELGKVDPLFLRTAGHIHIHRKYAGSSRLDEFSDSLQVPWQRPPIKRIVCAYGVGLKTPLGYLLKENNHSGFDIAATKFEKKNKEYVQYGEGYFSKTKVDVRFINAKAGLEHPTSDKMQYERNPTSGDGSYPYHSLSWCHNWLADGEVKVTEVAKDRFQQMQDHKTGKPHKTKDGKNEPVNTFFDEAHIDSSGREVITSVWEFDNVEHRGIIVGEDFRREFDLELEALRRTSQARLSLNIQKKQKSFGLRHNKGAREALLRPKKDNDCFWDYYAAVCEPKLFCEYAYKFGDIHLGQSCRLRQIHDKTFDDDDLQKQFYELLDADKKVDDEMDLEDPIKQIAETPQKTQEETTTQQEETHEKIHNSGRQPDPILDASKQRPENDDGCSFCIHMGKCVPSTFCAYKWGNGDSTVDDACHLIPLGQGTCERDGDCK